MSAIGQVKDWRVGVHAMALMALLLAALVPHGWMPRAMAGGVEMVLCTTAGAAPVVVYLGPAGAPQPDKAPAAHAGPLCLFATAHADAPPLPGAALVPPAAAPRPATPPTGPPRLAGAAIAVRLPPAQAPPLPL